MSRATRSLAELRPLRHSLPTFRRSPRTCVSSSRRSDAGSARHHGRSRRGSQVDIDNALLIEARYFTSLVTGRVAKNMIQAFFFDLQSINGGGSRPAGIEKSTIKKVGVLGAGMMGAGIAYVSAKAGFDVVLKDVTIEAANKGKAYSEGIEAKRSRAARPRRRSPTHSSPRSPRRLTRQISPASTSSSKQFSRARNSSTRCSRRSRTSSIPRHCWARTPRRCPSRVSPPA